MAENTGGSEFHVVLSGLKLTREVEERIDIAIRQVVMKELAGIDYQGDLSISPSRQFLVARESDGGSGGSTAGMHCRIIPRA